MLIYLMNDGEKLFMLISKHFCVSALLVEGSRQYLSSVSVLL